MTVAYYFLCKLYEGGTFLVKRVIYKGQGLNLGAEDPRTKLC